MPRDDRNFHRRERIAAIARWSRVGVQEAREPFPVERAFQERVARAGHPLFQPVELPNLDDVGYQRQVSYLVDAFDSLPARIDVAFDSAWKAAESATKAVATGNITDRLAKVAAGNLLYDDIAEALLANIPAQSCEYLFKRFVLDFLSLPTIEERQRHQPTRRIRELRDPAFDTLVEDLRQRYGTAGDFGKNRNGAMLLRLALSGRPVELDGGPLELSLPTRSAILLSGLLYTARNDRFHGESFSPFVSSAATLRTYTHPYFLFMASYSLLVAFWAQPRPEGIDLSKDVVSANVSTNLQFARSLFGRHWLG